MDVKYYPTKSDELIADTADLRQFVSRFSYKPNSVFRVVGTRTIVVEVNTVDVDTGERVIVSSSSMVGLPILAPLVGVVVKHLVRKLELHEMDEWFRYKGEWVTPPVH